MVSESEPAISPPLHLSSGVSSVAPFLSTTNSTDRSPCPLTLHLKAVRWIHTCTTPLPTSSSPSLDHSLPPLTFFTPDPPPHLPLHFSLLSLSQTPKEPLHSTSLTLCYFLLIVASRLIVDVARDPPSALVSVWELRFSLFAGFVPG